MRLQGKVAVVTGAGGTGIGRAAALRFSQEGAIVVCADRSKDAESGREMAEAINQSGGRAVAKTLDLLDHVTVREVLEDTVAEFSRIDVLFNVAIPGRAPPEDSVIPKWEWTFKGAFMANYFPATYGARLMAVTGGGSIINVSSIAGVVLSPSITPIENPEPIDDMDLTINTYGSGKSAVIFFTREMAVRYARQGVRVNVIAPGFMQTPYTLGLIHGERRANLERQIPMGRMGTAEDVASVAVFLASDESSYITGLLIPVDGGFNIRSL